jgi:hypothetical protein
MNVSFGHKCLIGGVVRDNRVKHEIMSLSTGGCSAGLSLYFKKKFLLFQHFFSRFPLISAGLVVLVQKPALMGF